MSLAQAACGYQKGAKSTSEKGKVKNCGVIITLSRNYEIT